MKDILSEEVEKFFGELAELVDPSLYTSLETYKNIKEIIDALPQQQPPAVRRPYHVDVTGCLVCKGSGFVKDGYELYINGVSVQQSSTAGTACNKIVCRTCGGLGFVFVTDKKFFGEGAALVQVNVE